MKIWLDALSPKQLFLFTSIADKLQKLGYEIWLTSRRYVQLDGLIDTVFRDRNIARVGEWGGGSLEGKLRASVHRTSRLIDQVTSTKPDVCFSSGSPEASRICYGLKIPHILISDTPHSPVNRLSAPLSEKILTPWVIPKREWIEAGAPRNRITFYKALDPCFWLRDFKPDDEILSELGLEKHGYIFLRLPETQSSYLRIDDEQLMKFVKSFVDCLDGVKIIVSCRYAGQFEAARNVLKGRNVIVARKLFPGPSITYFSMIFIGGGGTMTQEAALLGVPSISIYPKKLPTVLDFLRRKKLIIHLTDLSKLIEVSKAFLKRIDDVRKEWEDRSEKIWSIMKDPMKVVEEELKALRESSS